MSGVAHRQVDAGDISLHVAEQGDGPPIVLCHGFPHLWWSWRHQIPALAGAGWHVLAPDMRGYGRSSAPVEVSAYTNEAAAGDLLGLLDDVGEEQAVFAGFDFGAGVVWELALRHPERVRALIVLNHAYLGRSPRRPSDIWSRMAEKHFVHLHYFQAPGVADAELAVRPREFLRRVSWALSGECDYFQTWRHPSEGTGYLDALPEAPPLPWAWLSDEELDVYATEFGRTGFTGGLNWYRAIDLNWENTAAFEDAKVEVPTFFIAAERDCDLAGFSGSDPIEMMRSKVPDLRAVTPVPEAGHLVLMERPEVVNRAMLGYLESL